VTAFPRYVPGYRIELGDAPLPAELRASVLGVHFEEAEQVADRVEIKFANPDGYLLNQHIKGVGVRPFPTGVRVGKAFGPASLPPVPRLPAGLFDLDGRMTLALGYEPDRPTPMFVGEVTGVEADLPASGMPTLTVVAHDYLRRMTEGRYVRGFSLLPDAVIAAVLCAETRLVPLIDPAIAGASTAFAALNLLFSGSGRKQKGQSHHELLSEISAFYDATFWLEDDQLYVSRFFKEYSPRATFVWGESLRSFQPRVSTVGQIAGVSAKFTLREIPLSIMVTVSWDFDREALVISVLPGQAGQLKVSGGPLLSLDRRAIGSPADIATSAFELVHKLRTSLNNRLTAKGSCVGDPRVRTGAVIRFEGIGPDFSGDYRVFAAEHVVDGNGYRTNFKVRKEILP
jgi:hypothetical protein